MSVIEFVFVFLKFWVSNIFNPHNYLPINWKPLNGISRIVTILRRTGWIVGMDINKPNSNANWKKKNCTGTKTWKHFVIFAETVGPRTDGKHVSWVREMFQRHNAGSQPKEKLVVHPTETMTLIFSKNRDWIISQYCFP